MKFKNLGDFFAIEPGQIKELTPDELKEFYQVMDDLFKILGCPELEDDFLYFCIYDDLCGVVTSSCVELPAIADSCYIDIAEVFPHISD